MEEPRVVVPPEELEKLESYHDPEPYTIQIHRTGATVTLHITCRDVEEADRKARSIRRDLMTGGLVLRTSPAIEHTVS